MGMGVQPLDVAQGDHGVSLSPSISAAKYQYLSRLPPGGGGRGLLGVRQAAQGDRTLDPYHVKVVLYLRLLRPERSAAASSELR